jgi:predicted transcriptional regulator
MAQEPQPITLNLSPDLADRVEKVRQKHGWSLEQLVENALVQYIDESDWEELLEYGTRQASRQGLTKDDVERLVDEYRAEVEN